MLDGALDDSSARSALDAATRERKPIATISARQPPGHRGAAGRRQLDRVRHAGVRPDGDGRNPERDPLVKDDLLAKHNVLPLFKRGSRLFVGISDPTNTHALDEIKFHTNLTVEPILLAEDVIRRTMEMWLESNDVLGNTLGDGEGLDNLEISGGDEDLSGDSGVDAKGDDTPVVKFINKVLIDAIKKARRTSTSSLTKPTTASDCASTACSSRSPRCRSNSTSASPHA